MNYTNRRTLSFRKRLLMVLGLGLGAIAITANAQSDYQERDNYRNDRYEETRYEDQRDSRYDDRRDNRYDERRDSRYDNQRDRRYDDRYDDRRDSARRPSYRYCQDRAMDITGYRGPRPSTYRSGGALKGAIKGGLKTGVTSWALGGDKKEVRKARERGAKLGFIIGALKEGAEREKQRENDRLRRYYDDEVRRCMDGY